jgi:hypothetical protein
MLGVNKWFAYKSTLQFRPVKFLIGQAPELCSHSFLLLWWIHSIFYLFGFNSGKQHNHYIFKFELICLGYQINMISFHFFVKQLWNLRLKEILYLIIFSYFRILSRYLWLKFFFSNVKYTWKIASNFRIFLYPQKLFGYVNFILVLSALKIIFTLEQHVLDTNARKQLS